MEVAGQEPGVGPEYVDVELNVQVFEEAIVIVKVPEEAEEAVVGISGLFRQQSGHARHMHAMQQSNEDGR